MNCTRRGFIGSVAAVGMGVGDGWVPSAPAVEYRRSIPVEREVDVFVAGGGPAGIAAALAARRGGASVFLAEASGAFGGAATAAYVPAFATFTDGKDVVVGGIGMEIRRLVSKDVPVGSWWTPVDMEELKRTYDDLVSGSGVEFSFFTSLCDAFARGGRMEHAILSTKRGLVAVRARVFIDCTGDGDLVAFAGGAFEKGDEEGSLMPATLCSQWSDIDFAQQDAWPQSRVAEAIRDGVFSVPDPHLPGFFRRKDDKSSLGRGNIGHVFGVDPTDERSLTKAMVDARRRMPEYERFFKGYLKGYSRMQLASTAPFLGVRESRRIVCDRMMTIDDFMARASFADGIGRYCYPVDLHAAKPGREEFEKFWKDYSSRLTYKSGESYGISFASLVPKSFENVLVAGRCIGADRGMQASLRVMPCCFITGQAAGTAAAMALACGGETRKVDVSALRQRLRSSGACI